MELCCDNNKCGKKFFVDTAKLNKENPKAKCPHCTKIISVKLPPDIKPPSSVKGFLMINNVSGKKRYYIDKEKNTIGRKTDSGTADILIETDDDKKMSRAHFVIEQITNKKGNKVYVIYDCNSKYGTFVNGSMLLKGQNVYDIFYLNDHDIIFAGRTELLFRMEYI